MLRVPLKRNTWAISDECAEIWRRVGSLGSRATFRKGSVIGHQGETPQSFYFILEGEVHLTVVFPDGYDAVYDILGPDSMFGEGAALISVPLHCTARAERDTDVLCFDAKGFRAALSADPDLMGAFVQVQASQHQVCAQRLSHMFRTEPEWRVKEFILRMMRLHGQDVLDPVAGTLLAVNLTHGEIAKMTGLTRVTITRTLKRMCSQGVIAILNRRIVVLDVRRLASEL
ncbi:Crp/Fnr family transcriptional regulator [Achromobacter aloeverae]|uniref:Crp/Fnr family transcriptional regulator n=1 Tax=Achromobacter aloeverae TaxID=1750518 RepID=A0A4Q1HIP8_9BURK|nr:Crp/Fnr family transcriptional regulator [Achromobacter aloeverae]RXN88104.1 hypothetical protein C7R54_16185 [Achromobacter aloeverae]